MVKNEGMISKMSFRQRVQLITSAVPGQSCPVDKYEFPVFRLSPNPVAETSDVYATLFPSDKALASCWNLPLVNAVYRCIGNEAKATVPYAYFNVSNNLPRENVTEDYFYTANFLGAKARGIKMSGATLNFEDAPAECDPRVMKESVKCISECILRDAEPDSVITADPEKEEAEGFPRSGLFYGVAATKEEAAQCFNFGCSLVFLTEDFTEELFDYFSVLVAEYEKSEEDYRTHKIKLAEFDRRIRAGEVLDPQVIDGACDRMIDLYLAMRERNAASVKETVKGIRDNHKFLFNEVLHDNTALRAARESVVLLKNHAKTLPIDYRTKVAVIGECAKYPVGGRLPNATATHTAFDEINEYDILTVGYAHGYEAGQSGRVDLLETACELCAEADLALVYLYGEAGKRTLPRGQLELLRALSEKGVKIAAVVSAPDDIDLSFADACAALLFSYDLGQEGVLAQLDILTGRVAPSGKLPCTIPNAVDENHGYWITPRYQVADESDVRYPFGYGLSYTSFEYSKLEISEKGVTFTVRNTGEYDGTAVVQLYVQKKDSSSVFCNRVLRGFTKVFLRKGDAAKAEILFDENTFRSYDEKHDCYVVEKGDYTLALAEDAAHTVLNGELSLAGFVYGDATHTQETVNVTDGTEPFGFTETKDDKLIRREKRGLSFGLKLFLTLVLTLYFDGVGAALLLSDIAGSESMIFPIVVGVLLLVCNVLAVAYICVIAKRRKRQKYLHPNDVLSDLIEQTTQFDEIARVTYASPVDVSSEMIPETVAEEEAVAEAEEEEEEKPKTYEASFEEEEGEIAFVNQVSLGEICDNFRAYAASRGIAVEMSSVRALFAAMAASKIVTLSSSNAEALRAFLPVFNEYFGNASYTTADDGWNSADDLLWRLGGDKYVTSDFANAVYAAGKAPEKHAVAVLANVRASNLRNYFRDFIGYALYPSEEHTLVLNADLALRLPDNLCYVLAFSEEGEEMPSDFARAFMRVELLLAQTEPSGETVEIKTVSNAAFCDLVREAREEISLRKLWKKIDELIETLNTTERFRIGNKNTLQLEKLTAVLLECGGDETEALHLAFTAKLVPLLKTMKSYRKEEGDKTVYGIVEKIFADEDIAKIKKLLVRGA